MEGALQPPRGKKVAGAFRKARAGPLGIDRSNKGNKALKCSNRGLPRRDGCPQLRYELSYVEQVLRLLTNRLPKDLKAGIWPHQAWRLAVLKMDRPVRSISKVEADKRRRGYSTSGTGKKAPNWQLDRYSCMATSCCCGCSQNAGCGDKSRICADRFSLPLGWKFLQPRREPRNRSIPPLS
jgi:hypothetical protein